MTFVKKARSKLSNTRPKKKGKVPSKREIAQMTALTQLGMGTYQVGEIMTRSPPGKQLLSFRSSWHTEHPRKTH